MDTQTPASDAPQVDTAEVQSSEASQNTNQAPDAAQEVKAPEVKAEDTAEEKLYAGKYKSVEEMEKAYTELNTKFTTTAQEKAELNRILNEAFDTADVATNPAPEVNDYAGEEPAADPRLESLERKTAVQSFILSHNDADPASMQQVLKSDPLVNQIIGHEAKLEYAYLRSQNMSKANAIAEAEKRGADQTQAKIAEKQIAQVESAQNADQTNETRDLHTVATTGTPQERKAARLEYLKRNLANL